MGQSQWESAIEVFRRSLSLEEIHAPHIYIQLGVAHTQLVARLRATL